MEASRRLSRRDLTLSIVSGLAAVPALYLVKVLRVPTAWLLVAVGLAIALSGPVAYVSRRVGRRRAIAVVYLGLIAMVALVAGIVVPALVTSADEFAAKAPAYARDAADFVRGHAPLSDLDRTYGISGRFEEARAELPPKIRDAAADLGEGGVGPLGAALPVLVIAVLAAMLLSRGPRWVDRFLDEVSPHRRELLRRASWRVTSTLQVYLLGAFAQAGCAGLAAYGVLRLGGTSYPAWLAVLVFVLDLVPWVGPIVSTVLVGGVTLVDGFPAATVAWLVFSVAYLWATERLLASRPVEVNPFVAVVAVMFGIALLGVFGALVAVPVVAAAQVLIGEWFAYRWDVGAVAVPPPPDLVPPS